MKVSVLTQPHMFLETVELLFAYVNHISIEAVGGLPDYCLPTTVLQDIMCSVCADVSSNDPALQYFFSEHTLPDDAGKSTCIARNLIYIATPIFSGTLREHCAWMKLHWNREMDGVYNVATVGEFYLWFEPKERSITLLDSISALNMDKEYIRKLRNAFSNFCETLDHLCDLITPFAQKLELLLKPWVEKAEKRADQWKDALSNPGAERWFLKQLSVDDANWIDEICIQMRYLDPGNAPGVIVRGVSEQWEKRFSYAFVHMGLAKELRVEQNLELFDDWEFRALRLLGSGVRLRMLHALWDTPMSSRELAKALNLNLGSLCRDMNSLYECKLLILETTKDRKRYRTNQETMEYLSRHLAQLGKLRLSDQ